MSRQFVSSFFFLSLSLTHSPFIALWHSQIVCNTFHFHRKVSTFTCSITLINAWRQPNHKKELFFQFFFISFFFCVSKKKSILSSVKICWLFVITASVDGVRSFFLLDQQEIIFFFFFLSKDVSSKSVRVPIFVLVLIIPVYNIIIIIIGPNPINIVSHW